MIIPTAERVVVDIRKLRDYYFNPTFDPSGWMGDISDITFTDGETAT